LIALSPVRASPINWDYWKRLAANQGCEVAVTTASAFTANQQNDPSGLTVWGTFTHPETGKRRIILLDAWRKHLQFSADRELMATDRDR
jgi:hypothetical protein